MRLLSRFKSRWQRWIVVTGALITVVVLSSCGDPASATTAIGSAVSASTALPSGSRVARAPQAVSLMMVEAEMRERWLSFPAMVEAADMVDVVARVGGMVEAVLVREGDQVEAGAPVVRLDDQRARIARDQAAAAATRAQVRLNEQLALRARRQQLGRDVSVEELESVGFAVSAAQADSAAAAADLAVREVDLRDCVIRAPLSGIIDARSVRPGQQVSAGLRIASMVKRTPLEVRAAVIESEAARLRPGFNAVAVLNAPLSSTAAGHVVHVGQHADALSRMADVVIRLERDPGWLPGATVELRIGLGATTAMWIPMSAVRTNDRGAFVWIAEPRQGRLIAVERPVRLGSQDITETVEVLRGLEAGEQLIIRGDGGLFPGREVIAATRAASPGAPGSGRAESGRAGSGRR